MKNNYISPENIDELCDALQHKDENTFVIAGGTDLCIRFVKNQVFDYKIIDIGKVIELIKIEETNDAVDIGACVTMTELENSQIIKRNISALVGAAYNLGSTQIRNRATIGGNLANAAQCGDTIPVLFAFDADVKIINSKNEYRIEKVRDLVTGIGKTTLKEDEVITNIIIRKTNHISSFAKVGSRKTVTISKINCCGKFNIDENDFIKEAEIFMGAVGIKPVRADIVERELVGKKLDDINNNIDYFVQMQIENLIPDRSSKHYKKEAAIGVVKDMLHGLGR
ncbi:FAD binding domain-containing protein [Sedimentibacter sp.]|uniref:FAD binding domain-containing protein n=1 Tax=Sedimentibacter sp. TaxID=1960295 RepID=UPI00289EB693|nr:FAD binding domain-containing protein [Sedimentibacter sp.]